jgi:hypothetical protein
MYSFYSKKMAQPPGCTRNLLRIMKLTAVFLVSAILQVHASIFAQTITLAEKNAPLDKVFNKISDQCGYDFLISTGDIQAAKRVTINVQNAQLKTVRPDIQPPALELCDPG